MSKKGNRRAAIVFFDTVLTFAVLILIANKTVSIAKKQRTRFWIQYGTLKYDLIGPSGKVYRAGTRVTRQARTKENPDLSALSKPFYLTLQANNIL